MLGYGRPGCPMNEQGACRCAPGSCWIAGQPDSGSHVTTAEERRLIGCLAGMIAFALFVAVFGLASIAADYGWRALLPW